MHRIRAMILSCEQEQAALNELHKTKYLRRKGLDKLAKTHLNASIKYLHKALKYYQLERNKKTPSSKNYTSERLQRKYNFNID